MLTVLYIDDEPINLNLFKVSFRRDFRMFLSPNPSDALEIYRANDIDVVVTDQKMPLMTGFELIQKIKKETPDMNCILLTAYYEPELLKNPDFQSLVYRYIEKPFKKSDMHQMILEAAGI